MKASILLMLPALLFVCVFLGVSASATEDEGQEHDHQSHFSLFSLVKPLGIATLSFVCATFLTGLFRRKLGRLFLKIHVPLATISVILGLGHGILVLVLYS